MTRADVTAGNAWLRCYRQRPSARIRLVCLPHAGGTASFFRNWPALVPDSVELLAVQYPGREERYGEACVTDLRRLAGLVADAITPVADRPFALFGHSMGSFVAHEVALRWERRQRPPAYLFVSGHTPPRHHKPGDVHRGDDDTLVDELRRLGGTAELALADAELRAIVLPATRGDYRAIETYQPADEPKLNCPVVAYTGDDDPDVPVDQAADWAEVTTGRCDLRAFPGGHFYLIEHERALVADIVGRLDAGTPWP